MTALLAKLAAMWNEAPAATKIAYLAAGAAALVVGTAWLT